MDLKFLGIMGAVTHITRLRTWRERNRRKVRVCAATTYDRGPSEFRARAASVLCVGLDLCVLHVAY